jgi:hypothetical protein
MQKMPKLAWFAYLETRSALLRAGFNLNVGRVTSTAEIASLLRKLTPIRVQDALVRIGGSQDGGYLLPDDLGGIEYCFSPGVDVTASFEEALLERGIMSFLADYSVDNPPASLRKFVFDKMFLGVRDQGHFMTLETWIQKYIPDQYGNDLLLQMDIEGSEYAVLGQTSANVLNRFRIMVIEFHDLFNLFDPIKFYYYEHVFTRLVELFYIVHIHPNNFAPPMTRDDLVIPDVVEITFLRRDRPIVEEPDMKFPHPLDKPCKPGRAEVFLPECWYRS